MAPRRQPAYKKHSKNDARVETHYQPSRFLIDYLNAKKNLVTLQRQLTIQGKDLPPDIKHLKTNNERKRVNILKTHIFQAMADLICFFEFISNNSELQDDFEDEIEELLMGWNKNDEWGTPAFTRLICGATRWDYDKDPFNFRLSLLFSMQRAITLKISSFAKEDFDKDAGPTGISELVVKPDMHRAAAWVGLYARKVSESKNQKEWRDYHRPVLF